MTNIRTKVLAEAAALINGDREQDYGSPKDNFGAIAAMWSAYIGVAISPADVCCMMALLKIARLKNGYHADSFIDGVGYLALGAEVGG